MMEGKVLHNSPMADVHYNEMDKKMNKWLGNIAGLPINMTSATFLRCELGVPNAWEHHQCPFCEAENGMNGAHLLQCESLPVPLLAARDQLRSSLSTRAFAMQVTGCKPCDLVKNGLHLAQRVFKAARKAVQAPVRLSA